MKVYTHCVTFMRIRFIVAFGIVVVGILVVENVTVGIMACQDCGWLDCGL